MTPKAWVVLLTAPTKDGRRLQQTLVKEHLAACVNLLPVASCYSWKGKVVNDREVLLLIKTRPALFARLKKRIQALHPYDVPEIIALPVRAGNTEYLQWLTQTTKR